MRTLEKFIRVLLPDSVLPQDARTAAVAAPAVVPMDRPAAAPFAGTGDGVPRSFRQAKQRAQDGYIAGRLMTAFALSELLGPFPIDVEVRAGVVRLHGTVDSETLRDLAVEIAGSVDRVAEVRSHLRVDPSAQRRTEHDADPFVRRFRDACTTAKVKSRLFWNGGSHGFAIRVETRDDVVTLSGRVNTPADSDLAEQIALLTRGVRQVDNQLVLGHQKAAA